MIFCRSCVCWYFYSECRSRHWSKDKSCFLLFVYVYFSFFCLESSVSHSTGRQQKTWAVLEPQTLFIPLAAMYHPVWVDTVKLKWEQVAFFSQMNVGQVWAKSGWAVPAQYQMPARSTATAPDCYPACTVLYARQCEYAHQCEAEILPECSKLLKWCLLTDEVFKKKTLMFPLGFRLMQFVCLGYVKYETNTVWF